MFSLVPTGEGGDMVDVAVEAADGVAAEALGLAGHGAQRGIHRCVRDKRRVLHGRQVPDQLVHGMIVRRHSVAVHGWLVVLIRRYRQTLHCWLGAELLVGLRRRHRKLGAVLQCVEQ